MPKYLLLLHDNSAALSKVSPAEMQRVVAKYMAWSDKMGKAGHLRGGEKLRDDGGKHITGTNGKMVVRDGPFAEAKEIVGGYFLVESGDYASAAALCAECPHLELGGRIELREIEPMG